MNHHFHSTAALAASLLAVALFASAGHATAQGALTDAPAAAPSAHTLGQHPAILVQRQVPGIDPNHFIVAHPARLAVIATPSPTYAHPAVAVARMARQASDLDRYMAQPPVATAWLRRSQLTAVAAGVASAH